MTTSLGEAKGGELLELADRCEAASGPDRELDTEIAVATRWRWDGWEDGDLRIEERELEALKVRVRESHNSIFRHLPSYTASLDAAKTLVGDRSWRVENHEIAGPCALVYDSEGYAATPALALCAAALRAQATSNLTREKGK